jgi:alpha-D-ribose 1-methylphosphonate 5-triphosphate synthase subunit PhnH
MGSAPLEATELSARFLNVHDSQNVFRLLLDALSRPGIIQQFPSELLSRISPVEIPLLALLGYNTSFALVGADESRSQLIERATSGRTEAPETASYVAVFDSKNALLPMGFNMGSPMRPDSAAQVSVLINGTLQTADSQTSTFEMTGPGIEEIHHIAVKECPTSELEFLFRRDWSAPRGIDMWLVGSDGSFIGIPRTSRIQRGTAWSKGGS